MLIQSDYHIHASFYRVKGPGAEPGPTAAEQLAAARGAGSRFVGIVEHCNGASHHPFHCLEELSAEYHKFKKIFPLSGNLLVNKMLAATVFFLQ